MAETPKRKHVSEFVIQMQADAAGRPAEWSDTDIGKEADAPKLDSTNACLAALRKAGIEGAFRIINITKPAFAVKAETTKRMLIE